MRYEFRKEDGRTALAFTSVDDGHAIRRAWKSYRTQDGSVLLCRTDNGGCVASYAGLFSTEGEFAYLRCKIEIYGMKSIPQEELSVIGTDSGLRRAVVEMLVENGQIIGSEYLNREHNRMAEQKILFDGKVFSFTVACGRRQFAASDEKDVHTLGIPQDLRREDR